MNSERVDSYNLNLVIPVKIPKETIEIKKGDYDTWFNRGLLLDELGRYDEAVKSFDEVIEIKPDDYEAWFFRGRLLEKL